MPHSAYYGAAGRLYKQDPPFNAIFFKNLLLLDSVDHNPRFRQAMQAYADEVWTSLRDPATGLFEFDGSQPVKLLFQSAIVQIYATLASGCEGLPADGVSRRSASGADTLCRLRYSRSEGGHSTRAWTRRDWLFGLTFGARCPSRRGSAAPNRTFIGGIDVPLFMDRHDIPGVTAEQVAELHVLDLRVAAKHGVEFLTMVRCFSGFGVLPGEGGECRGDDSGPSRVARHDPERDHPGRRERRPQVPRDNHGSGQRFREHECLSYGPLHGP